MPPIVERRPRRRTRPLGATSVTEDPSITIHTRVRARADRPGPSPLRYLLSHPPLRVLFLAMLLAGFGSSLSWPQLGLFLTTELHLSVSAAGFYYLTNLAAPIAGYLIGSLSDRTGSRLPLAVGGLLIAAVGWVLVATAQSGWVPYVVNIFVLSLAGAANGQLFAAARDYLRHHPSNAEYGVLALLRISTALGWIVGPAVGAWLGALLGLRPTFAATAVFAGLAAILIFSTHRGFVVATGPTAQTGPATPDVPAVARRARRALLAVFIAAAVLMMSGESIKLSFLSIYMQNELNATALHRGLIISLQPAVEIIFMALLARLASRFGLLRIFSVGPLAAIGAYSAYAAADSLTAIAVGQLLMAVAVAAVGALGITIAQDIYPERLATATNVFSSSMTIAGAIGGLTGGIAGDRLGIPHLFVIPAALAGAALVLFALPLIKLRRHI